MAPIRLGFVGLSRAGGSTGDGSWAAKSHYPYLQASPHYTITALQNSSKAKAEQAAKDNNLPLDTVATYGDAESLAADPNVDLVAVSVRVPEHYQLLKPAIEAGKDVFVEWPLAANLQQAQELTSLAKAKGVKTLVGLQARQDPAIRKAREIVQGGQLGQILGTTLLGDGVAFAQTMPEQFKYAYSLENGANLLTIPFGHTVDALCYVLGEFKHLQATLAINQPTVDLTDASGNVVQKDYPKTSHDWVAVTGTLVNGGVASITYQPALSNTEKHLYWEIIGTKGTLVLEAATGHVQMAHPTLKLAKPGAGGVLEEIQVGQVPGLSTNVGSAWDAFAGHGEGHVTTFEDALVRQKMLDAILRSHDKGTRESYL